jgi:hypothetical protein
MRRAANPTDSPPGRLDGLLEGVASKVGQLATLVPVDHCGRSALGHDHAWVLRRASVVYPDVPVLAVPSRHRPARTACHNRTNRHQTAPQTTYKHIMELARNRQVGGSSPPSGSTDTPIDLRFCRLSAHNDCVVVRGVSVVHPSVQDASRRCRSTRAREAPQATASVVSKRLCGGRPITIRPPAPSGRASGSPRANGSRSPRMIPAMPQVRILGRAPTRSSQPGQSG